MIIKKIAQAEPNAPVFREKIGVSIYTRHLTDDFSMEPTDKVDVSYTPVIEFATNGIRSIKFKMLEIAPVEVEYSQYFPDGGEKPIRTFYLHVDVDRIKMTGYDRTESDEILRVTGMTLWVLPDFSIDYSRSEIDCVTM